MASAYIHSAYALAVRCIYEQRMGSRKLATALRAVSPQRGIFPLWTPPETRGPEKTIMGAPPPPRGTPRGCRSCARDPCSGRRNARSEDRARTRRRAARSLHNLLAISAQIVEAPHAERVRALLLDRDMHPT